MRRGARDGLDIWVWESEVRSGLEVASRHHQPEQSLWLQEVRKLGREGEGMARGRGACRGG